LKHITNTQQHGNLNKVYSVVILIFIMTQACTTPSEMTSDKPSQIPDLSTPQVVGSEEQYVIRPNDEIEILVWEQSSFNTQTTVSRFGTITIPLIGEIMVAGLTKGQLKRDLKEKLSEYIKGDINLTISIRNTDQMIVSVFGMVSRPNNYPVVEQTSIFRLLSSAGGPTENANMEKVKIYRLSSGPENYATLDLKQYLEDGQMNAPNLLVRPGDVVYVPEKDNVVREMSTFLRDIVLLFGIFRVFDN